MSRFPRLRRRPDHWADPHDQARIHAAERLDGPLGIVESNWLEAHLADCPQCAAIAADYEDQRRALRALREETPTPPRDLWARTSAGIEAVARQGGVHQPAAARRSRLPIGALSGIAVIVLVVGLSAMSGGLLGITGPVVPGIPGTGSGSQPAIAAASAEGPPPTPFAVDAGDVAYVRHGVDGSVFNSAQINQVCPSEGQNGCAALQEPKPRKLDLAASPRTIISAPGEHQAVAVGRGTAGGDQVVVVDLPTDQTSAPSSTPSPPTTTPTPSISPSETPSPTSGPVGSDTTAETASPSADVSGSASPTEPVGSDVPASAAISPTPTIAAGLAIASGVEVVGDSAAFSTDGQWFAFTARPGDGSGGPDVYVWRVGDRAAKQVTHDGSTVFASWAGDKVVASRPNGAAIGGRADPTSVVLDPTTGTVGDDAGAVWRPILDPSRTRAVVWVGSVTQDGDATGWQPGSGRLELRTWPLSTSDGSNGRLGVVSNDPIADYDVRWDETGEWFGLWVTDQAGAQVGRLSLFHVDPQTGELSRPKGAPQDEIAMTGFSIGKGRLAWATPPGANGDGSRIQVVAWRNGSVGSVETVPGDDLVVVR